MEPLSDSDPREVGPYRLEACIGEGGMGRVYLGKSAGGMRVAVKVMLARYAADPEYRRRFRREVEAARLVSGLHTARFVDADPDADAPWMATEYIEGLSLEAAVSRDGPLEPSRVAELGAALAEGLDAIHRCGLVHRDLKPSNILLSPNGPRIIDFGVAQGDQMTRLTQVDFLVGTPAYMSPEQLDAGPLGPASDVFALGGVLGFAATGRSPFGTGEFPAVSYAVVHRPPGLGSLSGPLRDLIGACLAKKPSARPVPSDLVARFAALAGPRSPASAAGLVQPDPQCEQTTAVVTPTPAPRPAALPPVRARELRRVRPPQPGQSRLQVTPPDDSWWLVAMDPASRWVAAADSDGTVSVWDPGSARALRSWPTGSPVRALAASPDDWLGTSGDRGEVTVWDVRTGEPAASAGLGGDVTALALNWPGGLLVTGGEDRKLRVWDVADAREPVILRVLSCPVPPTALALDDTGSQVAAGGRDGRLRIWDLTQAGCDEPMDTRQVQAGEVLAVVWDGTGERWLSSGADGFGPLRGASVSARHGALADGGPGRLHVFPLDDPTRLERLAGTTTTRTGAVFAGGWPGLLVAGGADGTLHLWDDRGRVLLPVRAAGRAVTAMAAAPDQARVAVCDDAPSVSVWELAGGMPRIRWSKRCQKPVTAAVFSPDGTRLVTAGDAVRGWRADDGTELSPLPESDGRARALAFDPAGAHLAAAGEDGLIRVWREGQLRHWLTGHKGRRVPAVAIGPDGHLVSAGSDYTIRTWNLATGREVSRVDGVDYQIQVLATIPDGGGFAAGCADGTIRLSWGSRWAEAALLDGHVQGVTALGPDRDGRYLASAGLDGTARVWNLAMRSADLVIATGPDGWAAATDGPARQYSGHGPAGELIWQAFGLTRRPLPPASGEVFHG